VPPVTTAAPDCSTEIQPGFECEVGSSGQCGCRGPGSSCAVPQSGFCDD
jgi:hypothetical protein